MSGYFDTIDHAALLRLVARRVSDGGILELVKRFLKAPIVEEKSGRRSMRPNDRGTPQGGVISPLLANLYLNSLDHGVNDDPTLDATLVRYLPLHQVIQGGCSPCLRPDAGNRK